MVTPRDTPKKNAEHPPASVLHPVEWSDTELLKLCELRKTRRSGPGGQHRNKVETAIVLTYLPAQIRVEASERRSSGENQAVALRRMRLRLAVRLRTPIDPASPSPLWNSRCRDRKISVSPAHADFPRLLAEALNHLAEADWNPTPAAERLNCSSSQLLKLIQQEPEAWTFLMEERRGRGLKDLKAS